MKLGKSGLLSIIIAGVLAVAIYAPIAIMGAQSTTSSTTCTSSTTSTSIVTTTTTVTISSISSNSTNGSFTYSPNSPVKVLSVDAVTTRGANGQTFVTFAVTFENIGNSSIYVLGGCGSGLESSIADSSVIQKVKGGPLCACAEFIMQLSHGQNHTSITPGCWSGYYYKLVQPGTVTVNFTQLWSVGGYSFQNENSTSIVATFHFT